MPAMRVLFANFAAALIWTVEILLLPFIEATLDPDPTDSYMGAIFAVPVLFLLAILGANTIAKWVISRGRVNVTQFVFSASLVVTLLAAIAIGPMLVTVAVVGFDSWANGIRTFGEILFLAFATTIPAAGIWWLLTGREHHAAPRAFS